MNKPCDCIVKQDEDDKRWRCFICSREFIPKDGIEVIEQLPVKEFKEIEGTIKRV